LAFVVGAGSKTYTLYSPFVREQMQSISGPPLFIAIPPMKENVMGLMLSKYFVNGMTLALCFAAPSALAEDRKASADHAKPLQEMKQYIPIGSATIVNNKAAITHSWFIDATRGAPIVCSAIANLQMECVAIGPPRIPHPAPPGVRYIGLGVSGIVTSNTAMTHAWYIDQFSEQVFVCQVLANLENGRCVQKAIPQQ
jgi:hypothetical protein